jgi:hypothetical protein
VTVGGLSVFQNKAVGGDSSRRFAAVFGQSTTGAASYSAERIGPGHLLTIPLWPSVPPGGPKAGESIDPSGVRR